MMHWARKHPRLAAVIAWVLPAAVVWLFLHVTGTEVPAGSWSLSHTWTVTIPIIISCSFLRIFGEDRARHDGYVLALQHAQQGIAQLTKTATLFKHVREREALIVAKEMLERLEKEAAKR